MRIRWIIVASLLAGLLLGCSGLATRSGSEVIDAKNLLSYESAWPNQLRAVEPIPGPDGDTLVPPGRTGVLVRVRDDGKLRVDFGRSGILTIAAESTDVIDRANAVLGGQGNKMGPNLSLAIQTKLVDATSERTKPFRYSALNGVRAVLCVFADLDDERIERIAKTLEPFGQREGVVVVLFPRSDLDDTKTAAKLRELGWPVPFAYSALSTALAQTLLPEGADYPWVQLATIEGRILEAGAIDGEIAGRLEAAIAEKLPKVR